MEFQCRVIVQRRSALPAVRLWKTFRSKPNAIPVDDKTVRLPTGIGVHLQTGMLFGITTEWCSASHRNRVHLRPDSPPAALTKSMMDPFLSQTASHPQEYVADTASKNL